jgi:hypothetical protein
VRYGISYNSGNLQRSSLAVISDGRETIRTDPINRNIAPLSEVQNGYCRMGNMGASRYPLSYRTCAVPLHSRNCSAVILPPLEFYKPVIEFKIMMDVVPNLHFYGEEVLHQTRISNEVTI